MTNNLRILSLGAGVQSSALALMIEKGEVPMVDAAIFADVKGEPKAVYEWLAYLKTQITKFPIHVVTWRNLKQDLIDVANGDRKIIPIPFFTIDDKGKKGMMRRQCTADYKIKPVTEKIRELLGLKKGEKRKKGTKVELLMGISKDEISRMKINQIKYIQNVYPLVEKEMRRSDCLDWMKDNGYSKPPRSACTFCPFHSTKEWKRVKENKEEWDEIVALEKLFLKNKDTIAKVTGMKNQMFLHRSCKPIDEIDFDEDDKQGDFLFGMENECEGMCGN
jgi:hypothetical protein